jgi:DNA-binding transcriptional LysR family regulator
MLGSILICFADERQLDGHFRTDLFVRVGALRPPDERFTSVRRFQFRLIPVKDPSCLHGKGLSVTKPRNTGFPFGSIGNPFGVQVNIRSRRRYGTDEREQASRHHKP